MGESMARLLLAGLLGLALVLLTVADDEDGQVDKIQEKAISSHDTNLLERLRRSADPSKNGKKKSGSVNKSKERSRKNGQKRSGLTKKNTRKKSKVKKKGKRTGKGKKKEKKAG